MLNICTVYIFVILFCLVSEIEEPPADFDGQMNVETFWNSPRLEIIARGLVQGKFVFILFIWFYVLYIVSVIIAQVSILVIIFTSTFYQFQTTSILVTINLPLTLLDLSEYSILIGWQVCIETVSCTGSEFKGEQKIYFFFFLTSWLHLLKVLRLNLENCFFPTVMLKMNT